MSLIFGRSAQLHDHHTIQGEEHFHHSKNFVPLSIQFFSISVVISSASLIGLSGAQISGKTLFLCVSLRVFWEDINIYTVKPSKQDSLYVHKCQQICRIQRQTKVNFSLSFNLPWAEHPYFCFLGFWLWLLNHQSLDFEAFGLSG